jgi:hypothetical protein
MEHHVNAIEDALIEPLKYKLEPGASYIQSRRQVSWYPSGSAIYSPVSGTRLIRIAVNSTGEWLDPQSVRLAFTLKNNDGTANHVLRTIGPPYAFFSRFRLMVGSVVCEDIVDYGRTHSMFHTLTSQNNRLNDKIEGFGRTCFDTYYDGEGNLVYNKEGITPGTSKRVCFKLLSGLFSQYKYIPLQFCPIVLELELDSDQYANILRNDTQIITAADLSTDFTIEDVVLFGDVVTLDNSLNNSYIEALMSGTALTIPFTSFVSQSHVMPKSHQFNANIVRSFTRLKSMFISFFAEAPKTALAPAPPGTMPRFTLDDLNIPASGDKSTTIFLRPFNRFYNPMGQDNNNQYSSSYECQWQLQIGSSVYPVHPSRSLTETFYRLKGSLGILPSSFHAVDINFSEYTDTHFIIGIDLEKIGGDASYSGLNTKAGDLSTIKINWDSSIPQNLLPHKLYVVMTADYILEIRDNGCQIFD